QMQQAIDEALHVKAVDHADGADPEEARPPKQEVAEYEGNSDERDLKLRPNRVPRPHQIRAPLLHAGRLPLIEPSQVCPPEPAVTGTRYIVDRVGVGVMIAMIRDPRARRA